MENEITPRLSLKFTTKLTFSFDWEYHEDASMSNVGYMSVNDIHQDVMLIISQSLSSDNNRYATLISMYSEKAISHGQYFSVAEAQNWLQDCAIRHYLRKDSEEL